MGGKKQPDFTLHQGRVLRAVQCDCRRRIFKQNCTNRSQYHRTPTDMGYSNNEFIQAGQELFRAVVRSFYKGISAVFLLYAINKEQTFIDLKNWMNEVH